MRGDPHSYQAIAHEDPGYWPQECEECHEAEAVEWDSDGERDLCAVCFDEVETAVETAEANDREGNR